MSLTDRQRADAIAILQRSGGRIPLFTVEPPRPLDEMTEAERHAWAVHAADQIGARVDAFLENIYNAALVKYHHQDAEAPGHDPDTSSPRAP